VSHSIERASCRGRSLADGCVVGGVAPGVSRPPGVRGPVSLRGLLPRQVTLGSAGSRSRSSGVLQGPPARLPGMRSAPLRGRLPRLAGPSPLAGVGSGAGRSAPRPCSTDESVTFQHRCRLQNALSFHGLGSPPRSPSVRSGSAGPRARVPLSGGPARVLARPGSLFRCGRATSGVAPRRGAGPSSESVRSEGCVGSSFLRVVS
jgi:hypothetical protein